MNTRNSQAKRIEKQPVMSVNELPLLHALNSRFGIDGITDQSSENTIRERKNQ